ncbi:hypothetical protein B8W95_13255, partial [Staphylococcus pasteuri]
PLRQRCPRRFAIGSCSRLDPLPVLIRGPAHSVTALVRLLNDELAVVVVADAPAPVIIEGSEQGCLVEMRAVQVGCGGGALQSEDKEKEG